MSDKTFSYLEVEAALCVWEWINDVTLLSGNGHDDWIKRREDLGSAELRHQSIALGQWCIKIYDILDGQTFFDMISYDWEVIPLIMGFAMTDDHHLPRPAIYEAELPDPLRVATFVAHEHLYNMFVQDCRLEAARLWAYADLVSDHEDRFHHAFASNEEPENFVLWLGEKYDLTRADRW
jgi:hypothetical protein